MTSITGLVLAAGAGTRAGGPKALSRMPDGTPWIEHAVRILDGCDRIVVVLGADAEKARALVPAQAEVVVASDWEAGMSRSLRRGIRAATGDAILVTLVDLPGLPASVVHRVAAAPVTRATLRQAVFGGRPGHPVLIGSDHWVALSDSLSGDAGARQYLLENGVDEVECGDLADGLDLDGPQPTLETDRLLLRSWRPTDAVVIHDLWTERDARVPPHRRIDPDGHPTVADLEARGFAEGLLIIEHLSTGEVIGYCGLTDSLELAYELLRRFWGHGYATEAARAVIDRARESGIVRLEAGVRDWNVASQRVLTKLGFVVERVDADELYGDSLLMAKRL